MKNFLKILTILFLGILGCGKKEPYVPDLSKEINYHHYVVQYMGEIVSYKYYNDKNQQIEEVGHEYRTKFIYNNQGKLVEKYNCRMYNCETGYRVVLKYDDNGNYLGSVTITGKPGEYDTTKFEQIVYYDQDNHCIKERSDKGTDVNGKEYECWKYYTYENNKISLEIETDNTDTVWTGKYQYDSKGNLISISRQRSGKYEK